MIVVTLVPLVLAQAMHVHVVFDARHPGAVLWAFPVMFFGATLWLGFVASAVRYFHRGDSLQVTADSSRRALGMYHRLPPVVFPIAGAVGGVFLYLQFRAPYVPLVAALRSGKYEVVEGVASSVRPGDPGGFTLITPRGVRGYKYSDHAATPGFHGLISPFEDGDTVRVFDVSGYIAHIEVDR